MTGNQYLWGNNPYSQYKMVNVETMKTLYDPCPVGYKVSPPDVYGAFLKYPIIDSPIGKSGTEFLGHMEKGDFYTPLFTKYGVYFYCGSENSTRKVYFISTSLRHGRTYDKGVVNGPFYSAHLCGTMRYNDGSGMNVIMSFGFDLKNGDVGCGFGGGNNYWLDRSTAAPVRCIRDE